MSNLSNLEIGKQFLNSVLNLDKDALLSLINDDFEWLIVPRSMGAEPARGREAIEGLVTVLSAAFEGTLNGNITRSVAGGDTVVFEVNVTGKTKSGKIYDNWYVNWLEIKDGKVSLWREHVDTATAMNTLAG